jgi:hypothetical protein
MATTQGSKPAAQTAKPATKITESTLKPTTNDTTTGTNPANAELQPQLSATTNTGEKPSTVVEDSISKIEEPKFELSDLFTKDSSELKAAKSIDSTDTTLQNQKDMEQKLKELREPVQSIPQIPTAGRMVTFFFAKDDGICTNNMASALPAIVVLPNELSPNIAVFTLDSRDPVVLRKSVPHISIAQKDSEDNVIRPYWDWPIIVR